MQNKYFKKIKLPDKPGIYLFKKNKKILYIGKATSLRDRVRSYLSKGIFEMRGPLIEKMAEEADKIDYQVTDSVLEAIILEANFIKKYKPKYNTKEKDDKSFNYVCITKEKLPKILVVRGRVLKNYKGSIFGPFVSGTQLYEALKMLRRIFPFIDTNSSKKQNYEFYKQLGLTPDALSSSKIYLQNIKYLKLFFNGKKKDIIRDLKKSMMQKAKEKEFEKAGELKRQLFALQHINDVALLKNEKNKKDNFFRIEAYDIAHLGGKNMVGAMVVLEDGEVVKSEYKKFKIRTQKNTNDIGALKEILDRRLSHTEWTFPSLIVVDGGVAQLNVSQAILLKLGLNISLVSVLKDEKHKPKAILGNEKLILKHKREIILANNEAHRFAIAYHKNMRNKNFLA